MSPHSEPLVNSLAPLTSLTEVEAEPLQRFCEALLAWMGHESSSGKSQILAWLTQMIGQSCGESLQLLRHELQEVEDAQRRLRSLATSSTIHLGDDGQSVLERLQCHIQQLSSVIDGLTAIQSASTCPSPLITTPVTTPSLQPGTAATSIEVQIERPSNAAPPTGLMATEVLSKPIPSELAVSGNADATTSSWLQQGRRRLLQGDAIRAIEDFTQALNINERDPLALCWRGDAHTLNRSFAAAIEDYSRALEIQPDYFLPMYNRAVACRMNGNLSEALDQFSEIVRLRPDHGAAYLNRGMVLELQGDIKRAELDYRKSLRFSPKSSEAMERLQAIRVLLEVDKPNPVRMPAPAGDLTTMQIAELPRSEVASKPDFNKTPARREVHESLVVRCPSCDVETAIHWNKLQTGRILTCPHCHTTFTTKPNGELSEVFKDAAGRWLFREAVNAHLRSVRERRLQIVGIASVVVLLVMVWWVPRTSQSSTQSEARLPVELEPRAELFARAWLAADSRTLRRLTDPAQDRLLFSWLRRNPPPHISIGPDQLAKSLKCEVTKLPSQPPITWVQVRIEGFERAIWNAD